MTISPSFVEIVDFSTKMLKILRIVFVEIAGLDIWLTLLVFEPRNLVLELLDLFALLLNRRNLLLDNGKQLFYPVNSQQTTGQQELRGFSVFVIALTITVAYREYKSKCQPEVIDVLQIIIVVDYFGRKQCVARYRSSFL